MPWEMAVLACPLPFVDSLPNPTHCHAVCRFIFYPRRSGQTRFRCRDTRLRGPPKPATPLPPCSGSRRVSPGRLSDPPKGEYPDKRMKRMTPTLHMSTAGEYSFRPSPTPSTSGATYCGLPHIVDSTVSGEKNLLSPKSAILTGESSRSLSMTMFSSFRSRCTIPERETIGRDDERLGCAHRPVRAGFGPATRR
jgi:hypothetical protein